MDDLDVCMGMFTSSNLWFSVKFLGENSNNEPKFHIEYTLDGVDDKQLPVLRYKIDKESSKLEGSITFQNDVILYLSGKSENEILKKAWAEIPALFTLRGDELKAYIASEKMNILNKLKSYTSYFVLFDMTNEYKTVGISCAQISASSPFCDFVLKFCQNQEIPFAILNKSGTDYGLYYASKGRLYGYPGTPHLCSQSLESLGREINEIIKENRVSSLETSPWNWV